ncbi:MAG: prolyl oligopeptidase family protein [bacterium]
MIKIHNLKKSNAVMKMGFIFLIFTSLIAFVHAGETDKRKAPATRQDNVKEVLHGVEITDPYRWLEDQKSPETRAWIDAQNEYTMSLLKDFPGREKIKKRFTQLMKVDVINTPRERNGRYFFTKRAADQDLSIIYMRQGLDGKDEALIDPHSMSEDLRTSVNLQTISQDGTILVYGVRQGGEDEVSIHLFDVNKRQDLPDRLPKARYFGISLTPDNRGFYYTHHGKEGSRLYFHKMGTQLSSDQPIFGEGYDAGKIVFGSLSEDGRYLLIHVFHGSAGKTELYYKNVAENGSIVTVVKDLEARTFGEIVDDKLYLETDWQAPNKRVMLVDLTKPSTTPDAWQEIIPESKSTLEGFTLAGGKLFANYLENVVSRVKVFEPDGTYLRDIDLGEIGSIGGVSGRWNSNEAFFSFSSFHIPRTIYRYDVAKGSQEVWAKLDIPVASENFEVKQIWYESKDKTQIPMFLVHAKGLKLDGSNPTYLTGYGGFLVSRTPRFSSTAALWVESGGVFALPNLRGGGEFGEEWHKAGMLANKQNVFDDFIAAAEWLIDKGYTNPSKLAIAGGSNGGLLVGAALTQRPDLFQAVICGYPLLDMVRYHKFLVARFWVPEYGSSEDDPEQFKYLLAYSPYHNVKKGVNYPAVLFTTGDADTRVAPLHARKMAALLQSATGSDKPVLLYYDTKSGHSGGKPVSRQIEDATISMSFLFWQLGEPAETVIK